MIDSSRARPAQRGKVSREAVRASCDGRRRVGPVLRARRRRLRERARSRARRSRTTRSRPRSSPSRRSSPCTDSAGRAVLRGRRETPGRQGSQGPGRDDRHLRRDRAARRRRLRSSAHSSATPSPRSAGRLQERRAAARPQDDGRLVDESTYTENYVIGGSSGGLETSSEAFPAGHFTTFQQVDDLVANSGGHQSDKQVDFVQLGPAAGSIVWHADHVDDRDAERSPIRAELPRDAHQARSGGARVAAETGRARDALGRPVARAARRPRLPRSPHARGRRAGRTGG